MELFVISMAVIGVTTTIAAIDEAIDWMAHYRREGELDHAERYALNYNQFTEQGYRE